MNDSSKRLPDPLLPEHQLIRAAAPSVPLSVDLKQRVLLSCDRQIRWARWSRRLRLTAVVAMVCGLLLLLRQGPADPAAPAPASTGHSVSSEPAQPEVPGSYRPYTPGGDAPGGDAAVVDDLGQPVPVTPQKRAQESTVPPREIEQIHFLIDELQQRERKLCGVLLQL